MDKPDKKAFHFRTTLKINQQRMLEAMTKSLGVVTVAAQQAGISRDTHYRWMREDEQYRSDIKALEDVTLDFAESQLHKQMKNGSTAATIFFLKTRAQHRGYIERQQIDVTSKGKGLSAEEQIDWTKLSPETLEELRQAKLIDLEND